MSRGPIPRRSMTPDEITMARALCPSRVRYVPATSTKRFARLLAGEAEQAIPMISPRQAEYLLTLCIRMRRQLPADVLAIAERMSGRPFPPTRRRTASAQVAVALLTLALAAGCSNCWAVPGCKAPPPPAPKDTVTR